ncbi:MAG: c-type cytochrome domain-containing protein, partial [Verrucomicrobiota bacterium]
MNLVRILLLLPSAALAEVNFEKEIEPIFAEYCFECHGDEKQKGRLQLNRLSSLLKGGDIGEPAV